jgi:hypothetical protein
MKKIKFIFVLSFITCGAFGQSATIQPNVIWSANASAVTSMSSLVAPPSSGAGTRLIWMAPNSAFRAGTVTGTQWNNGSIGKWSTALGYDPTASNTHSVAIGETVTSSHANSFALGKGVSTTVANQFIARFSGGYVLHSSVNATGVGVSLLANGNSWTTISDSTAKENFIAASGEDILKAVSQMRIGTWNYKGQNPEAYRHWGVMAQEFYAHFGKDKIGTIGNDTSIATADFDGVVFAAVKALEERTRKTNDEVALLRKENEELEDAVEELREEVEGLKQRVSTPR